MRLIRWLWTFVNARPWAWRTIHVCYAALLSRIQRGTGATWYTSQEFNQARVAGEWQQKNTLDLLAGCIGEALGELWRLHG